MYFRFYFVIFVIATFLVQFGQAVDRSKFRTCDQTSFCKRQRNLERTEAWNLDLRTITTTDSGIRADLIKREASGLEVPFILEITAYGEGIARLRINEKAPLKKRYEVQDVLLPSIKETSARWEANSNTFHFGNNNKVVISTSPLRFDVYAGNNLIISANERNLLRFEHLRVKSPQPSGEGENKETPEEEGAWEELHGSHKDSKPNGPTSVGMDFTFVDAAQVYGIPEHATSLALKATRGADKEIISDPYRLYNLDVFEYELDVPMALYGSVPFMIGHSAKGFTAGLFWLNAAETWIDVVHTESGRPTHWFSESGIVDVFFLTGSRPTDVMQQYTYLTGTTPLPQLFAIGYHQCRWNYKDEADVKQVDEGMDTHNIPCDVIWLDIEHTDGKRYFTWDPTNFPTPEKMIDHVAAKGRRMVTIVDPHIKKDDNYYIYKEGKSNGFFVKQADGTEYEGWCWPGASGYLDFTNPVVRDWWAHQFYYSNYKGSTKALYTWNDMNEPSVFNGPEVSMHKDVVHYQGWEHRDIHNLYGFYYHWATFEGLRTRNPGADDRPFVLSRAMFAGSQRWGAVWTGDNAADWKHLAAATPMILSLNLAAITFSGADVGGFFGNPESTLITRWYQAGAFYPFFRAHAHLDTKRREPWLLGEPYLSVIRETIRTRYALLPYWYTLFYNHSVTGMPVVRPMWMEFVDDARTYDMDDQFLVGRDLLVKPVTSSTAQQTVVYLPSAHLWYDYWTHLTYGGPPYHTIDTPLERIPVFQRGGSIIPRKDRPRRSTTQMVDDPYTLVVALDKDGYAEGELYVDDGHSYAYTNGGYVRRQFRFSNRQLTSTAIGGSPQGQTNSESSSSSSSWTSLLTTKRSSSFKLSDGNLVERVVVLGVAKKPKQVLLSVPGKGVEKLEFEYYPGLGSMNVVRYPNFRICAPVRGRSILC